VTFIHLSLQEFAAARYAAGLSEDELKNWVRRVHGLPQYREVLLLAAGSGAGDNIVRSLLELDSVEDPVSQVSVLAASALGEYGPQAEDVKREVARRLLDRLSSDIPLVAYEAGRSLLGLAAQSPDFVGQLACDLQCDRRPWVRLAALAVAVHAGKAFINPDILREIYSQLGGAIGFRINEGKAVWDTDEGKRLEHAMIGPATAALFEVFPQQEAVTIAEKKLFDDNITSGSVEEISTVLTQNGHAEIVERYNKRFAERFGEFIWDKRNSKAAETFFASLIAAAGLTPAEVQAATDTDFQTIGAVASTISLMHVAAYEYTNLGNGTGFVDNTMANVLKGVIAALDLQPTLVAAEAKAAIDHVSSGRSELDCFPNVPTEPKWNAAANCGMDIPLLTSALDHPSLIIVIGAANLLEGGIGGAEAAKAIEAVMSTCGENGLFVISHIAKAVWGQRAVDVLLERLDGELSAGCQHLFPRLTEWSDDSQRDRIRKSLLRGLKAESPEVAKGAAKAFLKGNFADAAKVELRDALDYWKVHEESYPVRGGIVPPSPREDLVTALVARRLLSLGELIDLSKDVRFDVKDAATNAIKQLAEENSERLREVLEAIERGELDLTLLTALAGSPRAIFARARDSVLHFLRSESAPKRVAALTTLSHPWIDSNRAIGLASTYLTDSDPTVRDQAVRTLRLLRSRK
jgi:HEAT repeat protein